MRTRLLLLLAAAAFNAAPADAATRNFGITSFERLRLEGPFKVRLANGVAPFARVTGAPAAIDRVSIDVQGRTLVVRVNPSWGGYPGKDPGPVEISIGTHELSSAWLRGSGSLEIDKIKGMRFELWVEGAGSAAVGQADVDQLRVSVAGSGSAAVGGRAGKLNAVARGIASIDTSGLAAKSADINADGPATIKASVRDTAKVLASGAAAVTLGGNPACTSTLSGSASVSGCRDNSLD